MAGRRGFSLVEVLVSLAVFMIFIGGLYYSLIFFTKSSKKQEERILSVEELRSFLTFLEQNYRQEDKRDKCFKVGEVVECSEDDGTCCGSFKGREGVGYSVDSYDLCDGDCVLVKVWVRKDNLELTAERVLGNW